MTQVQDAAMVTAPRTNEQGFLLGFEQLERETFHGWTSEYDRGEDTLYLRAPVQRPSISYYVPGLSEVWIRLDATTGGLTGMDVTAFRRVVVKKLPGLRSALRHYRVSRIAQLLGARDLADVIRRGEGERVGDRIANTLRPA